MMTERKFKNSEDFIKILFPIFNATIIIYYILNFDAYTAGNNFLLKSVYLLLAVCIFTIVTLKFLGKLFSFLRDIQITIFSVIILFLFFELLVWLKPNLVPTQISKYYNSGQDINRVRKEVLDYLNESPYVKFKPKTKVFLQGYTESNFVSEWETDHLGFKNLEVVSKQDKVDIVALGDSFTEGMGVATENTWPSILTARGYTTYNLGVQGYAPIQMEGTLKKYGLKLSPKYVIIGYTGTTFDREARFFNEEDFVFYIKNFTGGIQGFALSDREIRSQAKYIFSASYMLARSLLIENIYYPILMRRYNLPEFGKFNGIRNELYRPYEEEFKLNGGLSDLIRFNLLKHESKEWQNTLNAFTNIIEMSKKNGATPILLYLPPRRHIYYKAGTGKDLPDIAKLEVDLLKFFSTKNSILFVDPSISLESYVKKLTFDRFPSEFPYFELDGHMSQSGYKIVVDEILKSLH